MRGDVESPTEIVRGAVSDRPWGLTLGALGIAARTVKLTLRADEKEHCLIFHCGAVTEATSPVAADSAVRVALTHHMIAASQVTDLKRRIAAAPGVDEVAVIAAAVKLDAGQVLALRQKLVAQRAARTFSVERGTYEIEERMPQPSGEPNIDIRAVIYAGARQNLSVLRLGLDLRQIGTRFVLKPGALDDVSRYGFTRTERPVLEALRRGTSLPELEANQRDLDPRIAQAVIYALACCDAVVALEPHAVAAAAVAAVAVPRGPVLPEPRGPVLPEPTPPTPRGSTRMPRLPRYTESHDDDPTEETPPKSEPTHTAPALNAVETTPMPRIATVLGGPATVRAPVIPARAAPPPIPAQRPRGAATPPPIPPRTITPPRPVRAQTEDDAPPDPAVPRSMLDAFRTNRITTIRPSALAAHEVASLIVERTKLLDRGADHFALLGLVVGAPIEDVHAAYVELSRHLRPSRLEELGIADDGFAAQRLLAQLGIAFTVLTDRILRADYIASLAAEQRDPRSQASARR